MKKKIVNKWIVQNSVCVCLCMWTAPNVSLLIFGSLHYGERYFPYFRFIIQSHVTHHIRRDNHLQHCQTVSNAIEFSFASPNKHIFWLFIWNGRWCVQCLSFLFLLLDALLELWEYLHSHVIYKCHTLYFQRLLYKSKESSSLWFWCWHKRLNWVQANISTHKKVGRKKEEKKLNAYALLKIP